LFFESPAQLEEYVEARFPRRGRSLRSAKPPLPLIP
jgi:hypothetical protein